MTERSRFSGTKLAPMPLEAVGTRMALRQQGRGGGLKGHDLYRRVLRLQIPARAGDSAAGAGAGHTKMSTFPSVSAQISGPVVAS